MNKHKYYVKTSSWPPHPENSIDPGFLIFPSFEEAFIEAQDLASVVPDTRAYIEVGGFSEERPVVGIEKWKNATMLSFWPPQKRWTQKDGWLDVNEKLYLP